MSPSPWVTMWSQPRTTIRALLSNPKQGVLFFGVLQGIDFLINSAYFTSLGSQYSTALILLSCLIAGPLLGIGWLYLVAWLLKISGHWLEGRATGTELRLSVAWSRIPIVLSLGMWLLLLLVNPSRLFLPSSGDPSFLFVSLIYCIVGIWSFVLLIQSVREVQGFSIGRSVINVLIAWVLMTIIVSILSLLRN